MAVLIANNAGSELASSITATQTTITLVDASAFPTPTGGDWFPLTLVETPLVVEIAHCTARSGNTLTVARAQEGTAGLALSAGSRAELRMTRAAFASKLNSENYTADDVLAKIKTVDGAGSGLDADTLDGKSFGSNVGDVMRVGDFGIGGAIPSTSSSLDDAPLGSRFSYNGTNLSAVSAGLPDVGDDSTLVWWNVETYGSGSRLFQIASQAFRGPGREKRVFFRNKHDANWQSWSEFYHSGNFDPSSKLNTSAYTAADVLAKLLTVDSDTSGLNASFLRGKQFGSAVGDVMRVGDFGWGREMQVATNGINLDTANLKTGIYSGNGWFNTPVGDLASNQWGYLIVENLASAFPNYIKQTFFFNDNADTIWIRRRSAGTWSPWRKQWSDGNDGAGSGLDADLLDGKHASAFRELTNTSFPRYDLSSASTTSTLDLATRQVFTVDATTTARTLTFANVPGAGKAMTVVVKISGSNAITWPAGINWHGGTAPELGATFTNVVLFWDGVQWTGVLGASQ